MKNLAAAKNYVVRNRTKILIAVAVTSTTVAVLQGRGIKMHNEFLKEHNLFDEFYFPENSY